MLLQWAAGKRSLVAAVFIALVLAFHFLGPPSRSKPIPTHDSPLETEAGTSEQEVNEVPPPPLQPEPVSPPAESETVATPQPEQPRCLLTKVSMLYGAHKFTQLEHALESHRRHSERWGCGFESLEQDLTGRKLYSKHYFLLSTMLRELAKPAEERKEWLLWVDADSIILNPAISPCAFLPPKELNHVYALVTADHNGLNNGVFYLRVHPSSLDLLTQIAAYPLAHPDEDLGWFGEQAAMARVIEAEEAKFSHATSSSGIVWVPRSWFNHYEFEHGFEGEPGSFLVHFAGLAETRLSHMADWLNELQQNQGKWEIELGKTEYKDAIPRFWDEYTANVTTVARNQ